MHQNRKQNLPTPTKHIDPTPKAQVIPTHMRAHAYTHTHKVAFLPALSLLARGNKTCVKHRCQDVARTGTPSGRARSKSCNPATPRRAIAMPALPLASHLHVMLHMHCSRANHSESTATTHNNPPRQRHVSTAHTPSWHTPDHLRSYHAPPLDQDSLPGRVLAQPLVLALVLAR